MVAGDMGPSPEPASPWCHTVFAERRDEKEDEEEDEDEDEDDDDDGD